VTEVDLSKSNNRIEWMVNQLIRWKIVIVISMGVLIVGIQIIENPDEFPFFSQIHYLEMFLFFLLLAAIAGVIFALSRSIKDKTNTAYLLNLRHRLSLEFAAARDLEELTQIVLQFPVSIVPIIEYASLLIYYSDLGRFDRIGEWKSNGAKYPAGLSNLEDECHDCILNQQYQIRRLDFCDTYVQFTDEVDRNGFCLPLTIGTKLVASLHFTIPPGNTLTKRQADILNDVGTEVAIAIRSAVRQQRLVEIKTNQAAISERQQVFQDLHDVLAQNLGYLRLKLDQYSKNGGSSGSNQLPHTELGKMRDVADVSFEILRGTLDSLHASTTPYLSNLLNNQSRLAAVDGEFQYKFTEIGMPLRLPSDILQNTYFICKEVINNVAKHSDASQVNGKLIWGLEDLTIEITDNGKGFDPKSINPQGHYGLSIMQERVDRIHGRFDIHSTIGSGTKVTIWIPVNKQNSVLPRHSE